MSQRPHRSSGRRLRSALAAIAAAPLVSAGLLAVTTAPALAAATGGQGASLPYIELQAENAATNGALIGPSSSGVSYGTLADEASYRKAVTLSGQGKYVEFTTTAPTNSIDVRYSIPDGAGGSVYTAPLSLYINGTKQSDFTLTDAYSWYYGSYPFTNSPGSNPHHFYDEVHRLFTTTYPQGTKFRLQVDSEDTASSYTVDFADFEQVGAALTQPSGSVSVTSKGADPTGVADSTSAFNSAITAAGAGGTVWLPPGTYNIPGHIAVNNVTIAGAGMWYSTVTGTAPGFYGNSAPSPSTNVHLSNFAIFGNVQERCDSCQVNGIGGAMSSSTVSNIWIEHDKVGAWMDGPMDHLTFSGMRIRNTTADGINFHGGVTNSTVTNSDLRNTGDDGLATWADSSIGADAFDSFNHNTVQYPILANGIAIYGGHDNTVDNNRVIDAGLAQGGGIQVGQRFTSTQVGTTTISNNTMIRDGSLDPNWQFGVGALWFDGSQGDFAGPVNVSNALIEQSPYEAVQWVEGTIHNVNLSNVTIAGTGTYALQEQTGGSATFTNVAATGVAQNPPTYNCEGSNFAITDGGGNSGVLSSSCANGQSPTPVWPAYPNESGVSVTPTSLSFGSVATGSTSGTQTVTVSNTGTSSTNVSATISGQFADTTTCSGTLAANASCTYSVTFKPATAGTQNGTLAVTAGGTTTNVSLTGTGVAPGPILNANPGSLTFASTVVGSTSSSQNVTLTNTGTTSASVSGVSSSNGDFTVTSDNCTTVAVNSSCTVGVAFKPSTGGARSGTLTVSSNANNNPTTVSLSGDGIDSSTNIAAGAAASASSSNGSFVAGNVTDADPSSYWESANGSWPQWVQVDLASSYNLSKLVLRLPPSTAWGARTQTLSVQTSTDGNSFATVVGSAGYTFDPNAGNNAVTINLPANTSGRYVRLNITANTGWNAGQLSQFEVYPGSGGGGGSASLSASPSTLSFASQNVGTTSGAQTVSVQNSGSATATVSSITASGDFAQTNNCGSSIAAGGSCTINVTFTPTATGTRTGSVTVNSNATNSPTTVSLSGTGASSGGGNIDATSTIQAESYSSESGVQTETTTDTGGGQDVGWIANGDWIGFTGVDFGSTGLNSISARIASGAASGVTGTFEVHLDSLTNSSIGAISVSPTGGWQTWVTSTAAITTTTGVHTVYLKFVSSQSANFGNINWFTFSKTSGGTTNIALGKTMSASSFTQTYSANLANDNNTDSYWESANNAFPQWLQVDLGGSTSVSKIVLTLPPSTSWGTRTETLSVQGSTDGSTFNTIVGSAGYTFDPNNGNNTVTITFSATSTRYLRLNITGNTGWPAGQISEFEVFQ